ncbi:uncharacterized protein UV8b_01189 [Ustilaginoidea virens]|uniref:HTH APSES-type domain-containing protein n=1 Tax=Ustilaginoidea virens TaxID=1159556 RepID=A0A8E5HKJ4_USTVR|nr:uncharacterized protein UV8b_01189 [Ustilaginoidea virens]QUC16948.1 hypothetical protein UV8b_01189 [Ustilaginoidea virens]
MLPIEQLLNPVKASRHGRDAYRTILPHNITGPQSDGSSMAQPLNGASPATAQSPINFPPYERIDDQSVQQAKKYQIIQFGRISSSCEHIPYNSSKKDFFAKTGRECIQAFKYNFQLPGKAKIYTAMWDYSTGFVRMTPFFKCMGYAKTKPSQVLDRNPGLRDVCPSVTGGAVVAQGYWMPYTCARALCATFCHEISGALTPIFGPGFPADCVSPASPYFGDMVISQRLILDAKAQKSVFSKHCASVDGGSHGLRRGRANHNPCTRDPPSASSAESGGPHDLGEAAHDAEAKPTRKRKRTSSEQQGQAHRRPPKAVARRSPIAVSSSALGVSGQPESTAPACFKEDSTPQNLEQATRHRRKGREMKRDEPVDQQAQHSPRGGKS